MSAGLVRKRLHTSSVDSVLGLRSILAEVAPPSPDSTGCSKRLKGTSRHERHRHHLHRARGGDGLYNQAR